MEIKFVKGALGPAEQPQQVWYVFRADVHAGTLRKLRNTPSSKYPWQFLKFKVPGDPSKGSVSVFHRDYGFGTKLADAKRKVINALVDPIEALVESAAL